jgi:hypothetical protein
MDRDGALADFERARAEWQEAFARVPDDALTYLKPGDDYALGGLLVHVNWVLARYLGVLQAITGSEFEQLRAEDPPSIAGQARRGLQPRERLRELEAMARMHDAFRAAISRLPPGDWDRHCAVLYPPSEEPYPTSPEDLLGWLRDHYREHVAQCGELIEDWRAAKPAG